ncbi:hypothetical protein DdX_11851 [Ditylenchus destructor]|uniref:Uncharacterized protein n=1 Tax=Ditylenchus destructor TaxID=166010 RepID=A0AAD4N1U1_9BILA|nr:hypothetical protein DdX_11851 [Ditylenchus destructor]
MLVTFIFALLTSSVLIHVAISDDAQKGKEAMGSFNRNAKYEPFPAGIEEKEFFRTVKHALETITIPDYPPDNISERYEFNLNRPLKGRNSFKLPVFKTERPEAIAAIANLAGLKKKGEEFEVEDNHFKAVEMGKKLFRILQNHLIQKYEVINADSKMKPDDKKKKMGEIEKDFWKIQKEIAKVESVK